MTRRHERHGGASAGNEHELYAMWRQMKGRCSRPTKSDYPRYGGRGITFHPSWASFGNFVADVEGEIGPRPPGRTPGGMPVWTLDRIDNDGNYEPGNIRWRTMKQQAQNRADRPIASYVRGQDRWNALFTDQEVLEIRARSSAGEKTSAIAESLGISYFTINNIVKRKTWRHL